MQPKFYIINNGLKDLRGHYFETAISIAEAARDRGLHPILAAHVTCADDIVPEWLEFHRVFTTDHWMGGPPAPLEADGLRGQMAALRAAPAEALIDGTISFREYLEARFDVPRLDESPPAAMIARPPAEPPMTPRRSTKQIARRVVPPIFHSSLRRVLRAPSSAKQWMKRVARQCLPPVLYDRLKTWRRGTLLPLPVPATQPVAAPEPTAVRSNRLQSQLSQIGASDEYDNTLRFRADLERLLTLTGCDAQDHVFLPTAHGRELVAIYRMLQDFRDHETPTFHLEFRHALDGWFDVPPGVEHPYRTQHRVLFAEARSFTPTDRVRLYTDTEELAEEYGLLAGFRFGVLPIPFRAELIRPRESVDGPLCIAYFGDVRDEKGFHWLPELVDALMDDYVLPGRVRFLIQASLASPQYNARSQAALDRLQQCAPQHVRLVGQDGPLAPDVYYQLVSEADLLVCPYDPVTYHSRSSGTLSEGIAAGIPTVVPGGTWLSRHQPPGTGETFLDLPSFIESVRTICDRYEKYRPQAWKRRNDWLSVHTPAHLVEALLAGRCSGPNVCRAAA